MIVSPDRIPEQYFTILQIFILTLVLTFSQLFAENPVIFEAPYIFLPRGCIMRQLICENTINFTPIVKKSRWGPFTHLDIYTFNDNTQVEILSWYADM